MRVLVTAGAGFIGSNLCRRLTATPGIDSLVALDDLSTEHPANIDGVDVNLIEGSILDEQVLGRAAEGADAIVHLAARPSVPRSIADPVASHPANASGTVAVLEAARRTGSPLDSRAPCDRRAERPHPDRRHERLSNVRVSSSRAVRWFAVVSQWSAFTAGTLLLTLEAG